MASAISDSTVLQFRVSELFRLRAGPKRVLENVTETHKGMV